MTIRRAHVGCGAALLTLACSGSASTEAGEPPASASPNGEAGAAATQECQANAQVGSAAPVSFEGLTATIVDERGMPAPVLSAQVCGFDLCLNGEVADDGEVVVSASRQVSILGAAFKYGLGLEYAEVLVPLAAGPVFDLGRLATVRLPPPGAGEPLVAGGVASSAGLELTLAADAVVDVPQLVFSTAEEQQLRVARLPPGVEPPAVPAELRLEFFYAMTPVAATICPPAKLSVPNASGWPAGAEVELFLHGTSLKQQFAPYSGWARVSTARVSADGARIVTDDERGLPEISMIGFRRAHP